MKLSTKGRYAVMAMVDLARHAQAKPVSPRDIAERAGNLAVLSGAAFRQAAPRRAGEERARARAAAIAWRAARPRRGYRKSSWRSTSRSGRPAAPRWAQPAAAADRSKCLTHDLWEELGNQIHVFLSSVTLADVCERKLAPRIAERASAGQFRSRWPLPAEQSSMAAAYSVSRLERDARCGRRRRRRWSRRLAPAAIRRRCIVLGRAARRDVDRARAGGGGAGRCAAGRDRLHQRRHRGEQSGAARPRARVLVSAIEHESVLQAVPDADRHSGRRASGMVDLAALERMLAAERAGAGVGDVRQQRDRRDPADRRGRAPRARRPARWCIATRCRPPARCRSICMAWASTISAVSAHKLGGPTGSRRAGRARRRRLAPRLRRRRPGSAIAAPAPRTSPASPASAPRPRRRVTALDVAARCATGSRRAPAPRRWSIGAAAPRLPNTTCLSHAGREGRDAGDGARSRRRHGQRRRGLLVGQGVGRPCADGDGRGACRGRDARSASVAAGTRF